VPIDLGRPETGTRHIGIADLDEDGRLDLIHPRFVFRNLGACGDGVSDEGEACDDGNTQDCDGCDAACRIEVGFVCGDGVVSSRCGEECDEGGANGDVSDACRTDCKLPVCGDGIVDSGEECDDGNVYGCDGCSTTCASEPVPVCGDGVVDRACREECDDGGLVDGDGCNRLCWVEKIPGGGGSTTDCLMEWTVQNPSNEPLYDRRGRISGSQVCRDNDPTCDFDGGVVGSCTFRLGLCFGSADGDYPRCDVEPVVAYDVRKPSLRDEARSEHMRTVRANASAAAVQMFSASLGRCGGSFEVPVPLRQRRGRFSRGRLVLRSIATSASGRRDADRIRLTCNP
jgi:cysteine-rich repeat protein